MAFPSPPSNDQPIPNNPFYYPFTNYIKGEYGPFIVGGGIFIDNTTGTISAGGGGGGGVNTILAGTGIFVSPNVGGVVTVTNTGIKSLTAGAGIGITGAGGNLIISNIAGSGGTGTVTQVDAGAGLTGGPITTSGTLSLATTAVAPGTYNNPTITVDQYGRITFASPGSSFAGGILASAPLAVTSTFPQTVSIQSASTLSCGAVQLNDTVTSTSVAQAATARSVKETYDLASVAASDASTALTSASTALTTANNACSIALSSQACALQAITNAAIAQGTANQALADAATAQSTANTAQSTAVSAQTTANSALSSANARIPCSAFQNQGYLLAGTGVGTFSNLPVGLDTYVLTADSTAPTGLKWAPASGGGGGATPATPTSSGTVFGTTGTNYNTGLGCSALVSVTTGSDNTAIGENALCSNTTGSYNTAVGSYAANSNTDGEYNTAVGHNVFNSNTTGCYNNAYGLGALGANTTGCCNNAYGWGALGVNISGSSNTAIGNRSMSCNDTGDFNTAIGEFSLCAVNSGCRNVGLGYFSGSDALCTLTTQSDFVILGNNTTTCVISKVAVTVPSDTRWKKIAGEVPLALPFVNSLNPIKYQYCDAGTGEVTDNRYRYGFCAQEILANEENSEHPVIVGIDNKEMFSLNENQLLPVLVNAIKELSAKVEVLESKLAANG